MKESITCQPITDLGDIRSLLSIPGKEGLFIAFGIMTGLRDSEYRSLKWADVLAFVGSTPYAKDRISVYISKQSKLRGKAIFRDVFLHKTLKSKLISYFKERHQPSLRNYIFQGERGPQSDTGYMSGPTARTIWKKWCKELRVDTPWPSTHTGRKTFAYFFYKKHGIVKTMEVLQHRDMATTMRYIGLTREVMFEAQQADLFSIEEVSLTSRIESGEIDILTILCEIMKASPALWKMKLNETLTLESDNAGEIIEVIKNVERLGLHNTAKAFAGA